MDNTILIAIGVGNVNITQINEIASDPDEDFVSTVQNFNALGEITNTIVQRIRLCENETIVPECPENPVIDVVFIVDGSSSIRRPNFELIQMFVTGMVENFFRVENDAARIAYVRYNRAVDPRFSLNEFNTTADVIQAIDMVPYASSGTRTGAALNYTAEFELIAAAGRRPGVPAVVIVITDGRSQDSIVAASRNLQQRAHVVAIGLGGAVQAELETIATDPDRNVFMVNNFEDLGPLELEISDTVCFAGRTE